MSVFKVGGTEQASRKMMSPTAPMGRDRIAQGNALGEEETEKPKPRRGGITLGDNHLSRPFRAWKLSHSLTQGDALGYLIPARWA